MLQNSSLRRFPKHLKIATLGPESIIDTDIIRLLSEVFGFSYDLFAPKDNLYGNSVPGGNWTGLIGMIQRNEADIAMDTLAISIERFKVVNFAYPYMIPYVTFVTNKPEYVQRTFAVFLPFSWLMWILVAVVLLVVSYLIHRSMLSNNQFKNILLFAYSSILSNAVGLEIKNTTSKLLVASWLIFAFFISSSYNSILLASLTFPTLSGVRNIDELSLVSSDNQFHCYTTGFLHRYLSTSNDERFKAIADCVARSHSLPVQNHYISFDGYRGRKALISASFLLAKYLKDFYISDDIFLNGYIAIAVRDSFCCKDMLDTVIHRANAAGIFAKYQRDMEFYASHQNNASDSSDFTFVRPLSMKNLAGAFLIIFLGHLLALFVFIFEKINFKIRK